MIHNENRLSFCLYVLTDVEFLKMHHHLYTQYSFSLSIVFIYSARGLINMHTDV